MKDSALHESWGTRVLAVIARVSVFYPWVWLFSAHCVWMAARVTLGRQPRPLLDDPNALKGIVHALYVPSATLMIFAPLALLGGIVAVVMLGPGRKQEHPRARIWASQLMGTWFTTVLLMLFDPGNVISWYVD